MDNFEAGIENNNDLVAFIQNGETYNLVLDKAKKVEVKRGDSYVDGVSADYFEVLKNNIHVRGTDISTNKINNKNFKKENTNFNNTV